MKSCRRLAALFLILLFLPRGAFAADNRKITVESARSVESEKVTDELTGNEKTVTTLRGGVVIVVEEDGDTSRISADEVIYDRAREMMEARGNVRYERETGGSSRETFEGESMLFNVTRQQGVFLDGIFGRASDDEEADPVIVDTEIAARDSGTTIAFKSGVLTTCDDEEPHWRLRASRIWMLPGNEIALLNGVLYVGPLPVFYIPFFYYPGDEMIFHPVFGYRNRQGYFFQTTTYLYGRKPLADTSSSTFAGLTGGSGTLKKQVREGLFLRNTAEDADTKSTDYLKIKFDAYSGLGILAGVDGSFKPSSEWIDSLSFYADVGFSRTLFPRSSSSSYYTPFDTDGTTRRDSGWFWGLELPFRYRANLSYSMSKKPFSLSISLPLISDPYFKQDFTDRSEDLNWVDFFLNQSTLALGDDDITTETSYTWSVYGSVTPDISFLNPWITTLSISSVSAYVSFDSKTNGSLSGTVASYSPERRFFYPEYIKPSITFKAAGTLISSERSYGTGKKRDDAPDVSRLRNPFESEKDKIASQDGAGEDGEDEGNGGEEEQAALAPGVAQRLESAGYEFETALEELLETREEDDGDEEYTAIDLSRLRAAGEEMTAEELAILQAAGEELSARELGVIGSTGVSLTDEEIEEIESEIEEAFASIESSVEVSTAPSATARPVDRFIPAFSSARSISSRAFSSGAGTVAYSVDWDFTPSFTFEGTFDTSSWNSPSDVSFEDFSSLFYQIKTPVSLQGEFSYDRDFIKISSDLNFTNTIQDHFYLSESVYPSGGASRENVVLTDYTNSVFALEMDNEVSVRPFKNSALFHPVELAWDFTADLLREDFTGTASNPEWKVSAIKWDDSYVDTHSLTAVLGVDAFGYEETFSFTTNLTPLLSSYEGELDLSWFFGSFNLNGKYFQEESATGGTEWEWDPVEVSIAFNLPLDITFTTEYEHDFNENEPSTLSFKLSHDKFSAYYTMNNAIQYSLTSSGWEAKGTETEFKPYTAGFSFSNISSPLKLKFWKNRIAISAGVNTGLEFNLVKQTESSFNFSPQITIEIADVFDFTFSSTSTNKVIARYFQKWMGLDVEIPGETNIFIDLVKSFNFWSTSDRQSSGFKLSTLEMEMNHYLHDWTATLSVSISPELTTDSNGRYTYEFVPEITFCVSWNPASALGATAKTEDGRFTLSASGSND